MRLDRDLVLGLGKNGVSLNACIDGGHAGRIPSSARYIFAVWRVVGESMPKYFAPPWFATALADLFKNLWIDLQALYQSDKGAVFQLANNGQHGLKFTTLYEICGPLT